MSGAFKLKSTEHFNQQTAKLPDTIRIQLKKVINYLLRNPRHPSLKTHEVISARGHFRGKIFEAYVNEKYRLTWEYGESKEIILRNVDNHEDCLKRP